MKVKLVQKQLSALRDKVVDTTVIGTFSSEKSAIDFLQKRNYSYDKSAGAYFVGNTLQYPVTIEKIEYDIFDIRHFV